MKKVYCKDCRFSGDIIVWIDSWSSEYCRCKNPEDYGTVGTEYSGFYRKRKPHSHYPLKTELNIVGKCPYYKPKFIFSIRTFIKNRKPFKGWRFWFD